MVLTGAQQQRFYRIFRPFIAYVRDWLAERDLLPDDVRRRGQPTNSEVGALLEVVWGEQGHLEVLEAFAADEGLGLSRTDRRVVLDWSDAILADFVVCRRGHDTLFVFGDHAFAIRGISHEVDDDLLVLPTMVRTVIAPFDGLVTYLVCIMLSPIDFGPDAFASVGEQADDIVERGHLVRTARQFARMAPDAVRADAAERESHDRWRRDLDERADELAEGQHAGVLAGVGWDERERLVAANREPFLREIRQLGAPTIEDLVQPHCLNGRVVTGLEAILRRHPVAVLRERPDAPAGADAMRKPELVEAYLEAYAPRDHRAELRLCGADCVRDVRRLVEVSGRLTLGPTDARAGRVLRPRFPYVVYFRDGNDYVCVLADEVRRSYADVDWDDELARASAVDDAMAYLSVAVDYRGLVHVDEAAEELVRRFALADESCAVEAIETQAGEGAHGLCLRDLDGERYLVAPDCALLLEIDATGEEYLMALLDAQVGKPAYWPSAEEAALGPVERMCMQLPQTRDLLRYLDAHVPDDKSDYRYADDAVLALVSLMNAHVDPMEGYEAAYRFVARLAYTEAQVARLVDLATSMLNELPKRSFNGWSSERYKREVLPADRDRRVVYRHLTL